MDKILYFDFCAIAVFMLLLAAVLIRKMTRTKLNRYFVYIVADCIIANIADIYAIYYDNICYARLAIRYVFHTVYLLTHNLTMLLFLLYMISLSDIWHKYRKKRVLIPLMLPFAVIVGGLIENIFARNVFYINEAGKYVRGRLFIALYLSAIFYMAVGIYVLLRYRKSFRKRQFVSLAGVFVFMIAAVGFQYFKPAIPMEMFANAMGLLFILTLVQSAEDYVDSTTGLLNQDQYINDATNAYRNGKKMHVILINLLNYESVQDVIGYDKTRVLLRYLAQDMIESGERERIYPEFYHTGDGKFRIVLDEKYFKKTEQFAQLLCDKWKQDLSIGEMKINVTAYFCIAKCPEEISDEKSLLDFGRDLYNLTYNGEVLHAADIYEQVRYDMIRKMDFIIERALAEHEFEVYYQPIYAVKEKRFVSAEALLRLKSKEFGFVSPDIFIPAAEKSGAIHRIGRYVLEEVCSFIASEEFARLGVEYVEVNLSVVQCMRASLAQEVLQILEKYRVKPAQLNLEITETAASYSQKTLMKNIETLTKAGVYFSLDDFGTGYSNMCRIATMPFKLVKLDKEFANLEDDRLKIVLQNTIQMIKDMEMEIVVEGIETKELVEQFSSLSCEYIQGYYFSKPLPRSEYIVFMQKNSAV